MENLNNNQELIDFITFCKKQPEYIDYSNYVNSVIIRFETGIYWNIIEELIRLKLEFNISRTLKGFNVLIYTINLV